MYLPTPTDLQPQARGFPGAQITDGVKQVTQVQQVTEATQVAPKVTEAAATVTEKATEVASTVTDAATKAANTITSVGKDIKDKGQNLFEGVSALESLQKLKEMWEKYHQAAFYGAIAIICILGISMIYCCWHCWLDCCHCCCKDHHTHKEEAAAVRDNIEPPRPTRFCCCHWDKTYLARDCGRRLPREGEEWGFWGRKDGDHQSWAYALADGRCKAPRWWRNVKEVVQRRCQEQWEKGGEEGARGYTRRSEAAKGSHRGSRDGEKSGSGDV